LTIPHFSRFCDGAEDVGDWDGDADGTEEGLNVGVAVGLRDGRPVPGGFIAGLNVGVSVGVLDGETVGLSLGVLEGNTVGVSVGGFVMTMMPCGAPVTRMDTEPMHGSVFTIGGRCLDGLNVGTGEGDFVGAIVNHVDGTPDGMPVPGGLIPGLKVGVADGVWVGV
jgi:hypothetical protein